MTDGGDDIRPTDIVFDCPHCGKSLAIDYRGAGLTIPCTDCGRDVEVPIPEGMEMFDIDSSDEEQEIRILNLRKSLTAAEARISELENAMDGLTESHERLKTTYGKVSTRFAAILTQVAGIKRSLVEIGAALDKVSTAARE
jgi:transcription elongation factor Elf1